MKGATYQLGSFWSNFKEITKTTNTQREGEGGRDEGSKGGREVRREEGRDGLLQKRINWWHVQRVDGARSPSFLDPANSHTLRWTFLLCIPLKPPWCWLYLNLTSWQSKGMSIVQSLTSSLNDFMTWLIIIPGANRCGSKIAVVFEGNRKRFDIVLNTKSTYWFHWFHNNFCQPHTFIQYTCL